MIGPLKALLWLPLAACICPCVAADDLAAATTVTVPVAHQTRNIAVPYDTFTRNLESLLGRYDASVLATAATDPRGTEARIRAMEGEERLMIFAAQNHGALLALAGQARKAKRYHIGNPLVALRMTQLDVRAGLYAPLSVLVYQVDEQQVRVEYDRPSSLFGALGHPVILELAQALDGSLQRVLDKAAGQSR